MADMTYAERERAERERVEKERQRKVFAAASYFRDSFVIKSQGEWRAGHAYLHQGTFTQFVGEPGPCEFDEFNPYDGLENPILRLKFKAGVVKVQNLNVRYPLYSAWSKSIGRPDGSGRESIKEEEMGGVRLVLPTKLEKGIREAAQFLRGSKLFEELGKWALENSRDNTFHIGDDYMVFLDENKLAPFLDRAPRFLHY